MHFTFKQSQSATEMNLLYLSLILTVWVGEQKKAKLANCVHVTLSRQALSKTHGAPVLPIRALWRL